MEASTDKSQHRLDSRSAENQENVTAETTTTTTVQHFSNDIAVASAILIPKFGEEKLALGLRVEKKAIDGLKFCLSKFVLRGAGVKSVLDDDDKHRILLLKVTRDDLPKELQKIVTDNSLELVDSLFVQGNYDSLSYVEVLRKLLPENVVVPSAFERIGHIARLCLSETQLPYRKLIGEVILDKHVGIRTVVNKIANLASEFRIPDIELLAGKADYVTKMVENGLIFNIDYKNVYWNSRLAGERKVLTESIGTNKCLVCDVMAGVGAFSMYFATKGSLVLSNDFNPESTKWITENARLNKVRQLRHVRVAHRVAIYREDGRSFIKRCTETLKIYTGELNLANLPLAQQHKQRPRKRRKLAVETAPFTDYTTHDVTTGVFAYDEIHFVMNLPQKAIEFLDAFRSMETGPLKSKTFVHCYCFAPPDDYQQSIENQVQEKLGFAPDKIAIRNVRNVAPNKRMFCVEFCCDSSASNRNPE